MANKQAAIKYHKASERRRLENRRQCSRLRTHVKALRAQIERGEVEVIKRSFVVVQSLADKLVNQGKMHASRVARLKSRLNAAVKKALAS